MHNRKKLKKLAKLIKRQDVKKEAWKSYENVLHGRAIFGAFSMLSYRLIFHIIGSWQAKVDQHFEGRSEE